MRVRPRCPSKKSLFRWIPAALLLCGSLHGAAADEPPAYEQMSLEELLSIPVVVTASRQEEAATQAPATTLVITREEIRLRGYSFLTDALRDLPGMETLEYNFPQYGTQVPVRGLIAANAIIILVNGMRVNPPGGEPAVLRSDISIRDADQIEIVYGPGSTLYGQDAISAVINIITRQTTEENVKVSKQDALDRILQPMSMDRRLASVGMEFGYPLHKEVWGSLNVRFGEARIYGSVHYLDKQLNDLSSAYPEYWAQVVAKQGGLGLPLDPTRYDTGLNVMFRIEYQNASLQIWHRQSARSGSDGTGLPLNFGYISPARWADMSTVAEAKYTLPIGKYFSLESALTFNRYEIDPSSNFPLPAPVMPGQTPMWNLSNFKYGRGISGALEERLIFKLADRLHVVGGFFAAHYDITPAGSVPGGADPTSSVPAQAGDISYYTRQGDPTSLTEVARINPVAYQDFGGYVEGNWRIFKLLRLVVGLRLDKNTSTDELAFSPRASLIFNYESFSAKFIFARAFIAPAPATKFNIFQTAVAINGPNPNLQPETATSNELNLSFNHRYVSLGTSFYYNIQDNLQVQSGLPGNIVQQVWLDAQGMRAVNLTQAINNGSSQALGVDFYGKWNVWKLSGWGSYSFTNFSQTSGGQTFPMSGESAHNFRAGVSLAILKNLHATAGLLVKSIPENLAQPAALAGLIVVPWEINAHILYSPIPSIDLYVDLRNLTNHKYYLQGFNGPYPIEAFQGTAGLKLSF